MPELLPILRTKGRLLVLLMALGALGLGLTAVLLANLLRLDACHLCIFQRLTHFVIGLLLLFACWSWQRKALALLLLASAAAFSVWGMVASAQQSWLQWFPASGLNCNIAEPGLTEQVIDWLGRQYPLFFMATGDCGSKDLVILGLSLANWSFLAFLALLAGSLFFLVTKTKRF